VSQISALEADDLLGKLFSDRIPLRVLFVSSSGTRVTMPGFVDSKTRVNGVVISVSGPPIDSARGFLNFRRFDENCEFLYGETRELSEEMRKEIPDRDGESALMIRVLDLNEVLVLFFTL
jgi:hypothetical protein